MLIIVDNATRVVLLAGDNLTEAEIAAQKDGWCDNWQIAGAYTVYTATLPTGFLINCWTYSAGLVWAILSGKEDIVAAEVTRSTTLPVYTPWDSVGGVGTPSDNATVNNVTYSSSTPSAPVDGDLWCDTTSSPYTWKIRVSGNWQAAANYISTGDVTTGLIADQAVNLPYGGSTTTTLAYAARANSITQTPISNASFSADLVNKPHMIILDISANIESSAASNLLTLTLSYQKGSGSFTTLKAYKIFFASGVTFEHYGSFVHLPNNIITGADNYTFRLVYTRDNMWGTITSNIVVLGLKK